MPKNHVYGFNFAHRLFACKDGFVSAPADERTVMNNPSESDQLLRLIFTTDEVTHLPTGDLQYFVSSKASPEVKKFILDNLMMDVSSAANPPIPTGLDDDLAFQLMRQHGETTESYANRLNSVVTDTKDLFARISDVQSQPSTTTVANE